MSERLVFDLNGIDWDDEESIRRATRQIWEFTVTTWQKTESLEPPAAAASGFPLATASRLDVDARADPRHRPVNSERVPGLTVTVAPPRPPGRSAAPLAPASGPTVGTKLIAARRTDA
jgi:hypothetical protein